MADKQTLINELSARTTGLLYITESESGLEVLDWSDVQNSHQLEEKISNYTSISTPVSATDTGAFFDRIIRSAEMSGDEAVALAKGFRDLLSFLQDNFKQVATYTTGKIEVHIFIVCSMDTGCLAIHTKAIQT